MLASLEPYISLLEGYLLAKDRKQFAAALTDPTERSIIQLLTDDIADLHEYNQRLGKLGLGHQLNQALLQFKTIKHLQETSQIRDDQIGRYIRDRFCTSRFDFPRPTAYTINDPSAATENVPASITVQQSLERFLESKLKTRPSYIRGLNNYAISKVPEKVLCELPLAQLEYLLDGCELLSHFKPQFLSKLLLTYQTSKKKANHGFQLPLRIFSQMTRDQIDYLGRTRLDLFSNEDFVEVWFHLHWSEKIKKYTQQSFDLTKQELDEKRQQFQGIIKQLGHHQQHIIRAYVNSLKEEVFLIDLLLNDPSVDRLIEHLQTSNRIQDVQTLTHEFVNKKRQKSKQDEAARYSPKIAIQLALDQYGSSKAVEDYIQKLFSINRDNSEYIRKLSPYFREGYLKQVNNKCLLSQGVIPDNVSDYLSPQELQQLKDKKQLTLHRTNKKKYRVKDKVQLDVSIKNVKTVHIKIYELNLQKSNLLGSGYIADDINLSFLKPTYETIYEHKAKNAYAVDTVTIPVELEEKTGVFIVDLHGETVTSRAVIRKGAILCLQDFTEAGQKFSFYDEDGRPLTEKEGLQVWLNDRPMALQGSNFVEADYQQKSEMVKLVASVGNYSESFQKRLATENYRFEVGYLYNAESFLVGKKAKLILYGRLWMNENRMSLQLLQNTRVTVTLTNYQNISSFYEFQIPKWLESEDQIIEFPIQSYIQKISVQVTAKIILQTKKDVELSSNQEIAISLGEQKTNFMDFYLQKDKHGNYILQLLGLNGESITNADVCLNYRVSGVTEEEKASVRTDSEGKINLGPLAIVQTLHAQIGTSQGVVERLWELSPSSLNLSNNLYSTVGKPIVLPVDERWHAGDILLFKLLDFYEAENLSGKINFKNGMLHLPQLPKGDYVLKLLPIEKSITIKVHESSSWQGSSDQHVKIYDKNQGKVIEVRQNPYQKVAVQGITVEPNEPDNKVQIHIATHELNAHQLQNIRVHVFANNYIAPQTTNLFRVDSYNEHHSIKETRTDSRNSAYYSNKSLSDEGAYVWNRQKKGQTIVGNNLDKPGMFLKRALVRETKEEAELLSEEEGYIDECCVDPYSTNRRMMMRSNNDRPSKVQRMPSSLTSHNNFLLLSGYLRHNCKGTVTVDVPKNYNQLEVYVLTPKATIRKCFSLGETDNKKLKDLRHAGIPDTKDNKGWTMSREVYALAAGEKKMVSRNSQWRTVGLKEIFQFAKAKGCALLSWSKHLQNWDSYSLPEKRAIYDKQCCHELNSFLKFKDPEFFSHIVRPFISNKINKTFVDYCLLDAVEAVRPYSTIEKIRKLNAFEKCLLVFVLGSSEKGREEAERLVKMMESETAATRANYQAFKNRFDTIINAKESLQEASEIRSESISIHSNRNRLELMARKRAMPIRQEQECEKFSVNRREMKMSQKKAFVPVEATKQYTERTYYNVKDYAREAPNLVRSGPFWSKLARFLLSSKPINFLSEEFMTLDSPSAFVLAASFISSDSSGNFDLSNEAQGYQIAAKAPMLLFVKEVKELDFVSKFGVQINQRFLDPQNMHVIEDGIRVEREVEEFVVKKAYISQTVVTNTSGTPLELQILLDIPKGTIPLQSHEYTQIANITLKEYSSKQFKRLFYVPEEGCYPIYPSNACKGSTIISKCKPLPNIAVKTYLTINKLESFGDILRSGDKKEILKFIETKNIFDINVFNPSDILWMLRDREFFLEVVSSLRVRKFYNPNIWAFGFFHWDLGTIREVVSMVNSIETLEPAFFEYFPYYSTRTHRFANQSKSTIRNVQLKETYLKFLVGSIVNRKEEAASAVCFVYYLILQDRLREAQELLNTTLAKYPHSHQIQTDYMLCFLDMSLNTHNFAKARQILARYKDYPVQSWAKLFNQVRKTLQAEDEEFVEFSQGQKSEEFQTKVIQQVGQFKIIQPARKTLQVEIFQVDLELFFSESPFSQDTTFTSVRPSIACIYDRTHETSEIVVKRSAYPHVKDATVEITEISSGLPPKKVSTFAWDNPEVKVKVSENLGTLQAFVSRKKQPGAYVKVFSRKGGSETFYRDGYTDMTGTFRYAMSDLDGISEFSILVLTDRGGSIVRVKPPSKLASY